MKNGLNQWVLNFLDSENLPRFLLICTFLGPILRYDLVVLIGVGDCYDHTSLGKTGLSKMLEIVQQINR